MISDSTTGKIHRRTDPTYIFFYINKLINILKDNETSIKDKKETIDSLYEFIVKEEPSIPSMVTQEILITFHKNFIKSALFDSIERVREYSLKILIQYF